MPDAANLAAILYRLRSHNETVYRRIVATIRNWRHRKSDLIFGPHQLSDGTLRAIYLISLLM